MRAHTYMHQSLLPYIADLGINNMPSKTLPYIRSFPIVLYISQYVMYF